MLPSSWLLWASSASGDHLWSSAHSLFVHRDKGKALEAGSGSASAHSFRPGGSYTSVQETTWAFRTTLTPDLQCYTFVDVYRVDGNNEL